MSGSAAIGDFLYSTGLLAPGEHYVATPLKGGVSSDIWKVQGEAGCFCVKSALAQLRTAEKWFAPVSRNATEVDWFRYVGARFPERVPQVLAHDPDRGMFAMTYLPASEYPVWKVRLLAGEVDVDFAAQVGASVGAIHAASACDQQIAEQFVHYAEFFDLRISPYLRYLVVSHPALAPAIDRLEQSLAANRKALVHGDVSPKNILVGPDGPVILDAETASHGDPAFDVAFCLNHWLLKMVVRPDAKTALAASFEAWIAAYLAAVDWEAASEIEKRVAALLPALSLARIEGKSPVEYIDEPALKDTVRSIALPFLRGEKMPSMDGILANFLRNNG